MLRAFIDLIFDLLDDAAQIFRWLRANPIGGLGLLFVLIFLSWFADRSLMGSKVVTASFWEGDPESIRNLIWAIASVFGGAAGLYGLYLAGRRTSALDRQAQVAHDHRVLAEQGQITERFTKAVEQLGHEQIAVRLGAIYALERVAKDSERDFESIMETLAAYVREKSPWSKGRGNPIVPDPDGYVSKPEIDISAAINVLARSIPFSHRQRRRGDPSRIDLRETNLSGLDYPGAQLSGFRFDGSFFYGADLSEANFGDADLRFAIFSCAEMQMVDLKNAEMYGAVMNNAVLDEAQCDGARMPQVDLSDAGLRAASFRGVDLSGSVLERASMARADLSDATLIEAKFKNCNFLSACMRNVNLENAEISGANFKGVTGLEENDLSNAKYNADNPPKNVPDGIDLPIPVSP